MKKAHTRLNITLSKCPTITNISDNNDDGAIVLAVYITNNTIRAIQNWKISKVANEHIEKY